MNPLHALAGVLTVPRGRSEEYEAASRIVAARVAGAIPAPEDLALFDDDPLNVFRTIAGFISAPRGANYQHALMALRAVLVEPEAPPVLIAPVVKPAAPKRKPKRAAAVCPCEAGPKPKDQRGGMRPCPIAGCGCLTWSGRCRAHARTRADGKAYGTGHRNVRADLRKRWERTRAAYLREHPYCECAECIAIAEPLRPGAAEVDHIDGLGLLGPRAFEWDNLQSLTKAHHSKKTAGESFGQ